MGRKKKAEKVDTICLHCQKEFHLQVRWCPKCETHNGLDSYGLQQDTCDRCHTGENDRYLKRKKGSEARIAKEMARIEKEFGPIGSGPISELGQRYEAWCNSEAYKHRFESHYVPPKPKPFVYEEEEEIRTYEDPHGFIPGY